MRYRTTPADVEPLLRGVPGAAKPRAVMYGDAPVLLSRLEARFYEILKEERLPLPDTNRRVDGRFVDCRWPGLTVELNSYRYHGSRHAWELDNRRAREARARGDDYRRYTWADVFEHPGPMIAELRSVLAPASGAAVRFRGIDYAGTVAACLPAAPVCPCPDPRRGCSRRPPR